MSTATISTKYQIVIPKDVREEAGLKSGQRMIFIVKKGVIHMVPEMPLKKLKGMFKGIDITDYREHEDRY